MNKEQEQNGYMWTYIYMIHRYTCNSRIAKALLDYLTGIIIWEKTLLKKVE